MRQGFGLLAVEHKVQVVRAGARIVDLIDGIQVERARAENQWDANTTADEAYLGEEVPDGA
jgi:hypothetical protein